MPQNLQPSTAAPPVVPEGSSSQGAQPSGVLLHYGMLLTGFGTVFLGPMLPALSGVLRLSDRGAGTLLAAQFVGSFLGGWTTSAPLSRSLVRGLAAAVVGFVGLGAATVYAPSLRFALPMLLLLGFGVGQTITSVNLLASAKWSHRRGAALNLLNFSWSFGALTAPLLLLRLLRLATPAELLYGFAALLAAALAAALAHRISALRHAGVEPAAGAGASLDAGLPQGRYAFFAFLLFLYGGVETSLGGWLTTFDHRYGGSGGWQGMALSTSAFWASLTLARLLTPLLLRRVAEGTLLRLGLLTATLSLLAMMGAHGTLAITACAAAAGLSLSPWFPLVLSALVAQGSTASQAGRIIAVSGLGAAAMPWLVGQVSTASGSLRLALLLPAAGALSLLLLCSSSRFRPERVTAVEFLKSV